MANLPSHRASDSDRDQVAERLRHATLEGRLTPTELDERLGLLYASRTYGELDALVSDLPTTSSPAPAPARARRRLPIWVGPAGAATILLAALAVLGGGGHQSAAAPSAGPPHVVPPPAPRPIGDAHHALVVGAPAVGVLLVLALFAALVWLAIQSNKPSELR